MFLTDRTCEASQRIGLLICGATTCSSCTFTSGSETVAASEKYPIIRFQVQLLALSFTLGNAAGVFS